MNKKTEKTKQEVRMFTQDELNNLRNALPGSYYPAFERIWQKTFPNEETPISQAVYPIIKGKAQNDKILSVLVMVVEERIELKKRLNQAVNAHQQEAEAAY